MGKRKKDFKSNNDGASSINRILNSQNYHSKVTKWEILEISHEILELNICEIRQQLTISIKTFQKKFWNIKIKTFSIEI